MLVLDALVNLIFSHLWFLTRKLPHKIT
jgi:hypothetical protein